MSNIRGWAKETMRLIDELTPYYIGKAVNPEWAVIRDRLERAERNITALEAENESLKQRLSATDINSDGIAYVRDRMKEELGWEATFFIDLIDRAIQEIKSLRGQVARVVRPGNKKIIALCECDNSVIKGDNYCRHCGAKLDWPEEVKA